MVWAKEQTADVRDHQTDKADQPGKTDHCADHDRGQSQQEEDQAVDVYPQGLGGLFPGNQDVELVREEEDDCKTGDQDNQEDQDLRFVDQKEITHEPEEDVVQF